MKLKYRINSTRHYKYKTNHSMHEVPVELFYEALLEVHLQIDKFSDFDVNVFSLLGLRNLSAFIGELYSACFVKKSKGLYKSNPHQDGYPDILLMNDIGKRVWSQLESEQKLKDKFPFSPFANGGLEVKATIGTVPSPKECQKKNITRPELGDQRIEAMRGYDWKAHHRETNNLVGILWDFINKKPRISAIFFCSELTENDWGKIIIPKTGGGRTTSVSIMSRLGVKKMYENWALVLEDPRYINFLNKYNKDKIL